MLRLQRDQPVMYMSSKDAEDRGISDGEPVMVKNDIDSFQIMAKVSPANQVVDEISEMGGTDVANADDVATIPDTSKLVSEGPATVFPSEEEIRMIGNPEDVAPVAVYLASDEAQWINGQIVHISGDQLGLWSHP